MIYIFIHIIFVALFSTLYKYAALKKAHVPTCQFLMFSSAGIFACAAVYIAGYFRFDPGLTAAGISGGICMSVTIYAFFRAIQQGGLAVGWTFISLSVVLPVSASIMFWREIPSIWQVAGLLLLILCILLFGNLDLQVEGDRRRWILLITISALTTGTLMIIGKMLSSLPVMQGQSERERIVLTLNYLLLAYITGTGILGTVLFLKGHRFAKHELITGIFMGGLNVVANWGMLAALTVLPGIIVFPLKGGFGVLMTALIAVFLFKEQMTKRQVFGVGLGMLCVVLVNIK